MRKQTTFFCSIFLVAFALSVALLTGCSRRGSSSTAGAAASVNNLTGAGSTFVNPIMTHWSPEYQQATGTMINYQAVGSGAGISNLIGHTVDFACSDAPMNADESALAKEPVVQVPDVIGEVCVSYNVAGMASGLRFNGPVLADIFLGAIKYWDDPQILKLNPGKRLPHAIIFTIHRSDGSGTTNIFTDYLSKVSPDWKKEVGAGKAVKWPTGLGGKGNAGVAGVLKQHNNSIGYIELAYAVQNQIPCADMQNSAGNFITPGVASAVAAAAGFPMPQNMTSFITNTPTPQGYPITGFSWVIFYSNGPHADAIKRFITWIVTKGQADNEALYYAPLPTSVATAVQSQIQSSAPAK